MRIALLALLFAGFVLEHCVVAQTTQTPSESAVFFSGEVAIEDGSPPPSTVRVEQICGGAVKQSVSTDAQGRFALKVDSGGRSQNMGDATQPVGNSADLSKPLGNASVYSMPVTGSLRDCELQAVLAGFRSERVGMSIKSTLDNANVGTIILHPLSRAAAATISATTMAAPPRSRKAYEKGLNASKAQKWDTAVHEFESAVAAYPQFAVAWYELGLAHQNRNEMPEAGKAWQEALKSDPKYVKPYQSLTELAYKQEHWDELDHYATNWIQHDPDDFPAAYLFSAFAKAKRGNPDDAEKAARQGLRIDKDHNVPKLNYVLGILLMQKHSYAESAQCFRAYLEQAPNSSEAAVVRQQLPKLDEAAGRL